MKITYNIVFFSEQFLWTNINSLANYTITQESIYLKSSDKTNPDLVGWLCWQQKKGSFLGGAYTQMYCMVFNEWIYVQENCFNVATSFVWDKKVGLAQIGNRELFTLETTPTTADCYMRRQKRYIKASKYGVCKFYFMAHQTKRYYWKYHTNIRLESTFTSDSDNARAFAGQAVFYRWQKRQAPEVESGKNICSKCISLSFKIYFSLVQNVFLSCSNFPFSMIHPIPSHPTSDNLCPHIQLFIREVSHCQDSDEDDVNAVDADVDLCDGDVDGDDNSSDGFVL